jgi:hypothetical protein
MADGACSWPRWVPAVSISPNLALSRAVRNSASSTPGRCGLSTPACPRASARRSRDRRSHRRRGNRPPRRSTLAASRMTRRLSPERLMMRCERPRSTWSSGHPSDAGTNLGALISAAARGRRALTSRRSRAAGEADDRRRPSRARRPPDGTICVPTILVGAEPTITIAQKEIVRAQRGVSFDGQDHAPKLTNPAHERSLCVGVERATRTDRCHGPSRASGTIQVVRARSAARA